MMNLKYIVLSKMGLVSMGAVGAAASSDFEED